VTRWVSSLLNPITLLLAVACLQWVPVAEIGPFRLLLPYLAFALLVPYVLVDRRRTRAAMLYIRHNAGWLAPVTIYFVMMAPRLWGTEAANFPPRQLFWLTCGVGFAASVASARKFVSFRVGGVLGLVILIAVIEIFARRIGLSWTDAIRQFFVTGNLNFVVFQFFREIFNSIDPNLAGSAKQFTGSTKNDVANALLVVALLFRSASVKPDRDIFGMVYMGIALVLLVMLNDRSVLISAAGGLLIATIIGAAMRPVGNTALLALKLIGLLGAIVVGLGTLTMETGPLATLAQRFSFEDRSAVARLSQYEGAFSMIEKHPFTGNGYFEINGYAIHNAFLNAWAYGGFLPFLLVVIFYLVVLMRWMKSIRLVLRIRDYWVSPLAFEWVAALPFLPLFRMWLSGEGGIMKFGEWMAISAFFGCLVANELRRRALATMRGAQTPAAVARSSFPGAFKPAIRRSSAALRR
jgi:O-antigen ligase